MHPVWDCPEVEENLTLAVYDMGRKGLCALSVRASVNLWAIDQEANTSEIIIQDFFSDDYNCFPF